MNLIWVGLEQLHPPIAVDTGGYGPHGAAAAVVSVMYKRVHWLLIHLLYFYWRS